ncbi:hypothetical protein [Streptomyces sp. DSM 15324]|uniref:hypothetical protein n=1 Tax=Streptomyces sp. DSM 15324 TaxID=1739111 RepID=UPI00131DA312|nr:hypothetical protein [Streptomyces sp. DSM 15324]
MTDGPYPRLADVFPALAAEIAELLRAEGEPLAEVVANLPYHGPCTCSPTCVNLLTAPPGSSGSSMIQLERDGTDVFWLSLDPSLATITDIEVMDGRDLGPGARRSGRPMPRT